MLEVLASYFHCDSQQITARSVSGGDINRAFKVTVRKNSSQSLWFVKANQLCYRAMFDAELVVLQHLASFNVVRVPKPSVVLEGGTECYLVMEYLELVGTGASVQYQFGQKLAELHLVSGKGVGDFGYPQDNFIGTTPQINQPQQDNWAGFFIEHRLGYLVNKLESSEINRVYDKVLPRIREQLEAAEVKPALLHGDLWGGNWASCCGQPVMYDPASYYGHFEVDLALTELFGGFGPEFYRGYQTVNPIPQAYQQRKVIYNTYHILNHAVLFGGSYEQQAVRMLKGI